MSANEDDRIDERHVLDAHANVSHATRNIHKHYGYVTNNGQTVLDHQVKDADNESHNQSSQHGPAKQTLIG